MTATTRYPGVTSRFGPMLNKVPEITLYFWVIKILCTTVGETFADYLNTNLGFGINNTIYFMGALLAAALVAQFATRRYIAPVYWVAVVLISVFGTLITDKLTDGAGVPLQVTTTAFAVALIAVFGIWYTIERTLSMHSIVTSRREAFYWLAILCTFALGTAAGDLVAEQFNIGYLNSVILFGGIIVLIAIAHFGLRLDAVAAFWAAYVMTRPLGASIGDFLAQDKVDGGLGLGTTVTSLIFLTAILILVVYLMITRSDETGHQPAAPDSRRMRALDAAARFGWAGIAGAAALTVAAMTLMSVTGLAKTPSSAALEEDSGTSAAADSTSGAAAGSPSATIDVTLSEWAITLSAPSADAGAVTFNIKNAGPSNSHEFIILKTDIAPDALPTLKDKSLDESGAGITSPGESNVLAVGKAQTVTVNMTGGKYVFVDNIVEKGLVHWEKKAYATFTVSGSSQAAAPARSPAAVPPTPPPFDPASKLSVTGAPIGGTASATMHTSPGASCTITYIHPSGKTSTLNALSGAKMAGADGAVSWSWSIDPATKPPGVATVTVNCGSDQASQPITISPAAAAPAATPAG